MQPEKLLELSNFLARGPKSYNEIAKFLVMNTFSEERVLSLILGELIETGVVCPLAGFGWTTQDFNEFPDLPIQSDTWLATAIREKQVSIVNYTENIEKEYPRLLEIKNYVPQSWQSVVSIPVYPIGGMTMFSSKGLELTESMKLFYIAVGSLLGLYASRLPEALVAAAIEAKKKIDLPQVPLSDRQLVISRLLERGFNNAEIGIEIGYSESLVRQETVAIYRKLQVTGRKAMQLLQALRLEAEEVAKKETNEKIAILI